jgi:hypothetical protein
MMKITLDTKVDWPGKGQMTLGDAFDLLRKLWTTSDPISISLFSRRRVVAADDHRSLAVDPAGR